MRLQLAWTLALAALAPAAARAEETSWIFSPTRYTHSPLTGERVAQFSPGMPAYVRYDETYQESGYRHNVISLSVGEGADHIHIFQTWGQGWQGRPYGNWQYPYGAAAPCRIAPGATGRALGRCLTSHGKPPTAWDNCRNRPGPSGPTSNLVANSAAVNSAASRATVNSVVVNSVVANSVAASSVAASSVVVTVAAAGRAGRRHRERRRRGQGPGPEKGPQNKPSGPSTLTPPDSIATIARFDDLILTQTRAPHEGRHGRRSATR